MYHDKCATILSLVIAFFATICVSSSEVGLPINSVDLYDQIFGPQLPQLNLPNIKNLLSLPKNAVVQRGHLIQYGHLVGQEVEFTIYNGALLLLNGVIVGLSGPLLIKATLVKKGVIPKQFGALVLTNASLIDEDGRLIGKGLQIGVNLLSQLQVFNGQMAQFNSLIIGFPQIFIRSSVPFVQLGQALAINDRLSKNNVLIQKGKLAYNGEIVGHELQIGIVSGIMFVFAGKIKTRSGYELIISEGELNQLEIFGGGHDGAVIAHNCDIWEKGQQVGRNVTIALHGGKTIIAIGHISPFGQTVAQGGQILAQGGELIIFMATFKQQNTQKLLPQNYLPPLNPAILAGSRLPFKLRK